MHNFFAYSYYTISTWLAKTGVNTHNPAVSVMAMLTPIRVTLYRYSSVQQIRVACLLVRVQGAHDKEAP